MNRELKKRGIRMMSMNPGWVRTEFFDHALKTNDGHEVQYYDRIYDADEVVATGLKDLYKTRKDFSIHGLPVKAQVQLVKHLPHSFVMNTWLGQQKKAKNNNNLRTK
jgi:short-subunit dehydrogenase